MGWEAISSLTCHFTTIRKREREAILPAEMSFIKADKTNRASFPVVMVLKASLIMLVGFIPFWALLDSVHETRIYGSKL